VWPSRPGSSRVEPPDQISKLYIFYQYVIQTISIVKLTTVPYLLRLRNKIHLPPASGLDGSNDQFLKCING
jgi:hypothetical protein